jgi:hypothetical protein
MARLPYVSQVDFSAVLDMPSQAQLTQARILTLISHLVQRPARTDHRLPLIWLSSREQGRQVLEALVARLRIPRRYLVPHARVEATPARPAPDIRALLHTLCVELTAPRFGGERIRFRRYELAEFIMGLNLSQLGTEDRSREIITLLRERFRRRSQDIGREIDGIDFGPRYRLPVWLIGRLPRAFFRAAVSGKGFGSRYRWFMRQQYLAPLQSVKFLGFAERLTEGVREREDADQVDKLLMHAFLEDLRRAYRRRPWLIEGRRRTAYPVVLIDNATENSAGHRLLQLVNEVRNETGRSDPLLIVCSSDEIPQAPTQATVHGVVEPDSGIRQDSDPVYGDSVYREWVDKLPGSRRARVDTAWDLPISVTASDGSELPFEPISPRRPPRFARRIVVAAIAMVPILAGIGWVDWQYGGGLDCKHWPFLGHVNVRNIGGECIGYSDSSYYLFNKESGQEAILDIQNTIFLQNEKARNLWKDGKRMRPYVTLVYLGMFTGRQTNPIEEAYSGEREELEGLALAQKDSIDRPATDKFPLLNIVIANGGGGMKFAAEAADMIGSLAADDPTVVAVIGFDQSRDTTAKALRKLSMIGLPAIATTLSADQMDRNSQLYLQISAPNKDQAQMIGMYSKNVLQVNHARIYWTTGGGTSIDQDLYVNTLVHDLNATLTHSGITVDNHDINNPDIMDEKFNSAQFPGDTCKYQGVVIFAGRWDDFQAFLGAFNCSDNQPLKIIANDSVSRYVENPTLRATASNSRSGKLPVAYASRTMSITCDYPRRGRDSSVLKFVQLIKSTNGPDNLQGQLDSRYCKNGDGVIGERISAAYDAAELTLDAVQNLNEDSFLRDGSQQEWNPRSIVPANMYLKILQKIHRTPFDGVTGTINFQDVGDDPGEPVRKRISLLKVDDVSDINVAPKEVFHCSEPRAANESPPSKPGMPGSDQGVGDSLSCGVSIG